MSKGLFAGKYRISSTRLQGWDYSSPGYYFVTICTRKFQSFFGEVIDGEMRLSLIGEMANCCWKEIPNTFQMPGWMIL